MSAAELAAEKVHREACKNFGLSLFSTMDELHALGKKIDQLCSNRDVLVVPELFIQFVQKLS